MQYTTINLLALAATTLASPLPRPNYSLHVTAPQSTTENPIILAGFALKNSSDTAYSIAGERQSVYSGTSFFTNGNGDIWLSIPGLEDNPAGLVATSPGHVDGNALTVTATPGGSSDGGWTIDDNTGRISHKLFATTNEFYLCEDHVAGQDVGVVKFGNTKADGSLPEGCSRTELLAFKIEPQKA